MSEHKTRICFIETQGKAGSHAARDFADTLECDAELTDADRVSSAMGMLRRGDVDYVVTADTPRFAPAIGRAMCEAGDETYVKAWEGSRPVSYVVCSPRWMESSEVRAVIADDDAADRTKGGLSRSLPENCVRYGCTSGDVAAAGIRDRFPAYMVGTAIVCSKDAAEDAHLHIVVDDVTDAGHGELPFVAIGRA